MDEAVAAFSRVVDQPYAWLASRKADKGDRMIGCFPLYVPHELIHAAGFTPVDLYGGSGEMTSSAEYLQSITCYPVRSALELLLTDQLSFLDGAVIAAVCTGATSMGGVWHNLNKLPYYHQLVLPHRSGGEAALDYMAYQIQGLRTSLEAFGGRTIGNRALSESIALYNRGRSLTERLARVQRANPVALSLRDFGAVRGAASFMPRDEYVPLLAGLLARLEAIPVKPSADAVRLVLVGSLCDMPQFDVLAMVEEAGGTIVEDDSPPGRRQWQPVTETGDPIVALARRYLDAPPCPTKYGEAVAGNFEHLLHLARSAHAQGVVFLRPLYCDPAGLDFPLLSSRLNDAGLPTLSLDMNDREPATGQVQTRLQAFVEMLRR